MVASLLALLLLALLAVASQSDDEFVYRLVNEEYYVRERIDPSNRVLNYNSVLALDSRDVFWRIFENWESFKSKDSVWSGTGSRRTLTNVKYLVLPIVWSDDSATAYSEQELRDIFDTVAAYYARMSWNKLSLSYQLLDQATIDVSKANPGYQEVERAVRRYITDDLMLTEFIDYDAISIIYSRADNGAAFDGTNRGVVNHGFNSILYPGGSNIVRHEIGHNFGHPHHLTNLYQWRFDRGQVEFGYDTWDLMSGGNQWPISDFAAASKWHYNWITDDAIILMQPEGSTTECPSCVSSVNNLVLRPFDDDMVLPSSSNIMGVHIPILGSLGGGFPDTAYSYWLSYRSKIPQPSLGLSVHVVEFALQNNTIFGATYDSLNFDAFGHTETPFDSFVLPDTCYFLSPPGQILDLNPDAVEQVLPVVCVESVDGASITISVYFLNPDSPPPDAISPASTRQLGCSESGSSVGNLQLDLSNNQFHMFKYVGTGMGGTIVLDICVQNGPTSRATAYFYDQYPYAYLADLGKGSQPEYGAFRSFRIEDRCAGQSTRTYNSEYGETYVLVVPDESLEEELLVIATSSCTVSRCHVNQYLSIGQCNDCPAGSVAKSGSRSILECESCTDDGFDVLHPKSALCTLPTAPSVFRKATNQEWRALTVGSLLATGVFWMISDFRFYSQPNCSADSLIDISAATIKSGRWQITWPPDRAFDDDPESVWGGVPDSRSLTFIGVDFGEGVAVNCIVLKQSPFHPATKALIQAKAEGETEWKTVHIASDMVDGENVIQLDFPPTPQPTDPPTTTPTLVPTPLPTSPPISPPSKSPSLSPMPIPPSVPSEQPTKSPTLAPILIDSPSPIPSPAPTSCQREECDAFFGLGILKGTKYNANVLGLCVEKCIIPLFEGLFALFLSCGPCP